MNVRVGIIGAIMIFAITENELLQRKVVSITAIFILVGHVYLPREGCSWRELHCLRYHTYRIRLSNSPKDAVIFANKESFAVVKKIAIKSGMKGTEQAVGGTSGTNMDV